jgi:hypothetical protein
VAATGRKRPAANCKRADCRDDYVLTMLDPRAVARSMSPLHGPSFWDTNVLPTVQPYIEHATPDQLDPGYLYRVGEFLEELLLVSEAPTHEGGTTWPIIVPAVSREADGMMGGLDRRARAKSKDAPADIGHTLLWIGKNAKGIEKRWRVLQKAQEPDALRTKLRTLMDRMPWAAVDGKRKPYSNADKDLAAAAIAAAIQGSRPVRVYSRDQDILVLVRNTVTALHGYAGLRFDANDSLSVWKFYNRAARKGESPSFQYEPFWGNSLIKDAKAKNYAADVRRTTGVTKAMDAVVKAVS